MAVILHSPGTPIRRSGNVPVRRLANPDDHEACFVPASGQIRMAANNPAPAIGNPTTNLPDRRGQSGDRLALSGFQIC